MIRSIGLFCWLLALIACFQPSSSWAYGPEVFTNTGLYGGHFPAIAIDPTDPDKIFAGAALGDGLFVSDDGGQNWRPVDTGGQVRGEDTFKNHVVWDVDIAPSNPDVIWVAHNEFVEKSVDGGATWQHIRNDTMQVGTGGPPDDDFRICYTVAIDPTDPDIVYVGTGGPNGSTVNGAIYKTVNGGSSWEKISFIKDFFKNDIQDFAQPVRDIKIDPDPSSDNIWAITHNDWYGGKLYWGSRDTNHWIELIYTNFPLHDVEIKPPAPGERTQVYIAGAPGLFKAPFDETPTGLVFDQSGMEWLLGGWYWFLVRSISVSTSNPDVIYAVYNSPKDWENPNDPYDDDIYDGVGRVAKSIDGGSNWSIYDAGEIFFSTALHPGNDTILFAGHLNRGMFKITAEEVNQATHWDMTGISNGLSAAIIHDVLVDPPGGQQLLAATRPGLYRRAADGQWNELLKEETWTVMVDPNDNQTIYTGIEGFFVKSIDGGLNWTKINIPDYYSYNFISDIAVDPSNVDKIFIAVDYFGTGGAVHMSTDGGDTFVKVLDGQNLNGQFVPFNAVAIDPLHSNRVFAGSGLFSPPGITGELWLSEDGGTSWNRTSLQDVIVNTLAINPHNPDVIYAGCGYSGGTQVPLYVSTNGGQDWVPSSAGIAPSPWNAVTDLGFHSDNSAIVYLSTLQQGVYLSPDAGLQWFNLGTPDAQVYTIGISSLYAGTEKGLLQLTGTGVIAGQVTDGSSGAMVDGATVFNDFNVHTTSVAGNYVMVSPAGFCDVTATATGQQTTTEQDVIVRGADVTWVNIEMGVGPIGTSGDPTGDMTTKSASGGGYCFIGSAAGDFDQIAAHKRVVGCLLSMVVLALFIPALSRAIRSLKVTRRFFFLVFAAAAAWPLWGINDSWAGTLFQQVGISGSPNPVGSGARAQGMGGAFIAVADDATAASWNPAGLIQLEKPEMSVVAGRLDFEEEFTSSARPETDNTGTISDTNLNYLSATIPFHWHRNMVVSVSYQRLYDFQRNFSHQLNYAGIDLAETRSFDQDGFVGALGLAGAVEVSPKLSFGVTVNLWTDQLLWDNGWTENYAARSVGTVSGSPRTIDTVIKDEYSQFRGINVNLGMLYNPVPALTIGAVIKTPFTATLRHEFYLRQTEEIGPPVPSSDTISQSIIEDVQLEMPLSYGVGIAWRLSDALTVDADIYRTHWSDYTLEDDQGNRFSPIDGNFKSQSDVSDTTQVRVGAEYLIILPEKGVVVPLRCGVYYDPEPAAGSSKDFYGVALGSGLAWKNLVFDVSYNYRWGRDVDAGNLIGTSKADVTQQTILASLIYHFD